MVASVTNKGVLIPASLLKGVRRVEIRKSRKRIIVTPAHTSDPLSKLGKKPVDCGVTDGSINHDKHLYGRGA